MSKNHKEGVQTNINTGKKHTQNVDFSVVVGCYCSEISTKIMICVALKKP